MIEQEQLRQVAFKPGNVLPGRYRVAFRAKLDNGRIGTLAPQGMWGYLGWIIGTYTDVFFTESVERALQCVLLEKETPGSGTAVIEIGGVTDVDNRAFTQQRPRIFSSLQGQ